MAFKIPSLAETRDLVVALGRALFPGLNFASRRSYHGKRATFIAGAVTSVHSHVDSVQRDLHPLTAGDGKPINDWGDATGVLRKGATPARKSAAARVRGAAGATVTSLTQLNHPETGLIFELTQAVTIPGVFGVDPDSFFDADIAAVSVGSATRLEKKSVLKFLATPPNIQGDVVLQLALDEDGFDAEQFGAYRARVLATFSETPSGGSQADFVTWALESLDTVRSAFAYPTRAGAGTIDVVVFYAASGTARSVSLDDRELVADYIRAKAPFHVAGPALRVIETIADPQRVEILVRPNGQPAFDADWDDSGAPEVAAWTLATRALQFDSALPASLRAGHRLILDGFGLDGREFKIESIFSADTVILETEPPDDPVGALIYSGGPLVAPIRNAIVAHLNGEIVYAGRGLLPLPESAAAPVVPTGQSIIGLEVLAEGIGSANPNGVYGRWAGGIRRATLFKIAMYKNGIRNATIVTPASDYEAVDDAFPLDDQIHYVTPDTVVVRYTDS